MNYEEEYYKLAAHVERLCQAWWVVRGTDDNAGAIQAMDDTVVAVPSTSLARHDLLNQAVTLEELGDTWDWERCPNHKDLRHLAQQKRRQAGGGMDYEF